MYDDVKLICENEIVTHDVFKRYYDLTDEDFNLLILKNVKTRTIKMKDFNYQMYLPVKVKEKPIIKKKYCYGKIEKGIKHNAKVPSKKYVTNYYIKGIKTDINEILKVLPFSKAGFKRATKEYKQVTSKGIVIDIERIIYVGFEITNTKTGEVKYCRSIQRATEITGAKSNQCIYDACNSIYLINKTYKIKRLEEII